MIRPWEVAIGLRYTRARRRSHFISFITLVSLVGVTLSVAALIIVLSVMNGFGKELRTRILGAVSHVTITTDRGTLSDWPAVAEKVKSHPQVKAHAPYVLGQAMLARGGRAQGAFVRGVIPEQESKVADFGRKMIAGSFDDLKPGQFGVVVGSTLAWKLDLAVGSQVSLMVPQGQATPVGMIPRYKRFTVVGIYRMGHHEYDSALALTHLDDAALLQHTAIFGRSGAGKTNLLFKLLRELTKRSVPTWIFDWKRDYRPLVKQESPPLVFTVGRTPSPFLFNPLIPPSSMKDVESHIGKVVDLVGRAFYVGHGVKALLSRALSPLLMQLLEHKEQVGRDLGHDLDECYLLRDLWIGRVPLVQSNVLPWAEWACLCARRLVVLLANEAHCQEVEHRPNLHVAGARELVYTFVLPGLLHLHAEAAVLLKRLQGPLQRELSVGCMLVEPTNVSEFRDEHRAIDGVDAVVLEELTKPLGTE